MKFNWLAKQHFLLLCSSWLRGRSLFLSLGGSKHLCTVGLAALWGLALLDKVLNCWSWGWVSAAGFTVSWQGPRTAGWGNWGPERFSPFLKVTLVLWTYELLRILQKKKSETLKYLLAMKWEKKTAKSKLINVKCLQNVTLGQRH